MKQVQCKKKITFHWTVTGYGTSEAAKKAYHYHITYDKNTKKASIVKGKFEPEANFFSNVPTDSGLAKFRCRTPLGQREGTYAAHCGGGNTNNIGISLCAMAGYQSTKNVGPYPITRAQYELMCELAANLCYIYDLRPTEEFLQTHYTFGLAHPNTSSAHKIDIIVLPFEGFQKLSPVQILPQIIKTVNWYYGKLVSGQKQKLPELKELYVRYGKV